MVIQKNIEKFRGKKVLFSVAGILIRCCLRLYCADESDGLITRLRFEIDDGRANFPIFPALLGKSART